MPLRIYEPVPGITGVSPGSQALIPIPVNRRMLSLRLFASANGPIYGAAVMGEVQTYVNDQLIRQMMAQEMLDRASLNELSFTPATDGIPEFYIEPWRELGNQPDQGAMAWDLFGQSNMYLKIAILSGVVNPVLTAEMIYDDGFITNAQGQRVLRIVKILAGYFPGGTVNDILTLPKANPINRLMIYPPAGTTIQQVQIWRNSVQKIHDKTPAQNLADLKDYHMVAPAPAAGAMYPVVFDQNQAFDDALQPPQALQIRITSDLGGTMKIVSEQQVPAYL